MRGYSSALLVLVFISLVGSLYAGTQQSEANALCALKAGFTNWKSGTVVGCKACVGWTCSGTTATTLPCSTTWSGVSCSSSGYVTRIELGTQSLQGTISSSISLLTQLNHLNFGANSFHGM